MQKKKSILNKKKKLIKYFLILINIISFFMLFKLTHIRIALCTMGKNENLYVKEFINYYTNLGIDKIFIYDDNDINTEKIRDVVPFTKSVVIYDKIKNKIKNQGQAYTNCYNNNKYKYNWFLMIDFDEYLVIVNNTLKNYLSNPIFKKCDFIKFHWVYPAASSLLHYDNRSLFERFKGPYRPSNAIKTIIKGNIKKLHYWVHSPFYSPERNITCNNIGKIIKYKKINFETIDEINIDKAYIIHFYYKSIDEYINKMKRGYSNWFKINRNKYIYRYIKDNNLTKKGIDYIIKQFNKKFKKL